MLRCEEVIPEFDENGNLPPGVHFCEWEEFVERFGTNDLRLRLMRGLRMAMEQLKAAGCRTIYINGSFVTWRSHFSVSMANKNCLLALLRV
ncbi:hypothetical protein [Planktothrix sp. FACHB-1355]|nr:hypothetical protein [Planktothrix sp. FACHB-1355]